MIIFLPFFLFFFLCYSPLFCDDPVYSSKSSENGIVLRDQLSSEAYHGLLRDPSDHDVPLSPEARVRYQNVAASKDAIVRVSSPKYKPVPPKTGLTFGQVARDMRRSEVAPVLSGASLSFKDLSKRFRLSSDNARGVGK